MLRFLLRYLANNEKIVQKLAESRPMRRAAQFVVYLWFRGKSLPGVQQMSSDPQQFATQLRSFARRYVEELKKGIEEAKQELKKK